MPHTARAHWEGDLKNGKGTIGLGSGAFEGPYSFKARFEGAPGQRPRNYWAPPTPAASRWRCRLA